LIENNKNSVTFSDKIKEMAFLVSEYISFGKRNKMDVLDENIFL
jgi:hypothetical protein